MALDNRCCPFPPQPNPTRSSPTQFQPNSNLLNASPTTPQPLTPQGLLRTEDGSDAAAADSEEGAGRGKRHRHRAIMAIKYEVPPSLQHDFVDEWCAWGAEGGLWGRSAACGMCGVRLKGGRWGWVCGWVGGGG